MTVAGFVQPHSPHTFTFRSNISERGFFFVSEAPFFSPLMINRGKLNPAPAAECTGREDLDSNVAFF